MNGQSMNPLRTNSYLAAEKPQPMRLLLTGGEMKWLAQSPEKTFTELQQRATQMSQVLEEILCKTHRPARWGLNE